MTPKEEEMAYKELVWPTLVGYGFAAKGKGKFVASRPFGWDEFGFVLQKRTQQRVFEYSFSRRFEQVENFLVPYYEMLGIQPQIEHITLLYNKATVQPEEGDETRGYRAGYQYDLTIAGIESFAGDFKTILNESIFPKMRQTESVAELDLLVNTPVDNFREIPPIFSMTGMPLKKLVIARLANNPKYEDVYTAIKANILSWNESYSDMAGKYLKATDMLYETLNAT